jgi:hypothetical protein
MVRSHKSLTGGSRKSRLGRLYSAVTKVMGDIAHDRERLTIGLERLESRTLMSAAFSIGIDGSVDSANMNDITGWAADPSNPTASVSVELVIAGGPTQTFVANEARSDLTPIIGSANHGFIYATPVLTAGTHTASVYEILTNGSKVLLSTATLTSQNSLFDEHYYLEKNPDVAAVVASGAIATGYDHYIKYGQFEGRSPSPYWDESLYLQDNADVAAAVKSGAVSSGFMHYYLYGQYENRPGLLYFNTSYYLDYNSDVAAAVKSGALPSAFEHFVDYGQYEGRSPMLYFSSSVYDANNPSILPSVTGETYSSDFEQFVEGGQYEGLVASNYYNEATYLADNPDVAAAVKAGVFPDGFQHWLMYGQYEGRTAVQVAAPMAAPSGLTATAQTGAVQLSWTDHDSSATGYQILRGTDGTHFLQVAQLTSGSAVSYTDSTVSAGTTYYYEVIATSGVAVSAASNVANVAVPTGNTGTVTIATRFASELVITANGPDDAITVSESGSTLTIDADGSFYTEATPADGLFIYARGGTDSINVGSSVITEATVETIDGAVDTINSADATLSAWIDSNDIFTGSGKVHSVSAFAGGVSKATGASLANPSDATNTEVLNDSLFGSGPVVGDVNQGGVGDCYLMSSLAAFATSRPSVLSNSVVDIGDGTYVVQFMKGTTPTYVRVNNQFDMGNYGGGLEYAHMGSNNTLWALVFEKAYAFYYGGNFYAALNTGWMTSVYTAFGVSSTAALPPSDTDAQLFNQVSTALANGEAVTMGTSSTPANLVANHAYTVISAYRDANGVAHYEVRNPWGVSGDSLEDSHGYATLTFAQIQSNFFEGTVATS